MAARGSRRVARPVFLAAPDQGAGALALIEGLLRELQVATGGALKGSDVFVPHLQVGDAGVEVDGATWFARTLEGLASARVVVAVLDGPQVDEHVAFLLGYAFAAGKPTIGYATDGRAKGALPEGACREVATDVRGLSAALARVLL
ncbi:MAG: Nucleoside 2-deoxyribosyltransferase [Thermoplasmata archaeon]|jgi:nucleoside 2-deoxyribosyltransferase|nr:Nucleoside 2-deoxyribosyltransferase [Thermoplasmata archaeon]